MTSGSFELVFTNVLNNREFGSKRSFRGIQLFLVSLCIHLAVLAIFGAIVIENTPQVRETVAVQMVKAQREIRKTRQNYIRYQNRSIQDHQMPKMMQYTSQMLINPANLNVQNSTEIIPIYQYELPDAKPSRVQPSLAPIKHAILPPKAVVSNPKPYVPQESIFDLRQPIETAIQKPSISFHSSNDIESKLILQNFLKLVSQRIEKAKRYPSWALNAGVHGRVVVRFTILQDGTLEQGLQMVESSGNEILDNAAITAIKTAAPFPAIPPSLEREKLQIELPMDFKLTES